MLASNTPKNFFTFVPDRVFLKKPFIEYITIIFRKTAQRRQILVQATRRNYLISVILTSFQNVKNTFHSAFGTFESVQLRHIP